MDRKLGTVLLLIVLYTFYDGIFKRKSSNRIRMKSDKLDKIGLAMIGCGTIGRIRANIAKQYPGVEWLGLCDLKEDLGKQLAKDTDADFFTTDVAGIT